MIRRLLKEERNQRGEVMIEASFILVSIIILLLVLLSISFMFYQVSMMSSVANEISADVAKNYKFTDMEMGKSEIMLEDVNSVKMFRMNFGKNGMEKSHQIRSETYAKWRIALSTMGINAEDVNVDCEIKSSGIGRSYVKVTVSQKSEFFLSGILDAVGITEKSTMFSATAYAECVDLTGYTSMVNFTEYASHVFSVFNPIGTLYTSVGDFYDTLKGFIEKLMN